MKVLPRRTWNDRARVPFATVAVLILMLSMVSTAYLGGIQRQEAGRRLVEAEISRQESAMHRAETVMEEEAGAIASRAVLAATEFLCNQSMLDTVFQENYSAYVAERFPLYDDPYAVDVSDIRTSIFLDERNLHDLALSNNTVESNITLEDGDGNRANGTVRVMNAANPDEFRETTALATYVVAGRGNCTVRNVRTGAEMHRPVSFRRNIDSPFPLMNSKMQALDAQGDTDTMGLARTVRYVLTTLAQFRVMEGYGSGLDDAPGDTDRIITHYDVQLALNLAMVLETARLFRSYDRDVLEQLEALGLGSGSAALSALVGNYLNTGTLDPADIVALYTGLDRRQIPVGTILAQAFNVIADQFVLKYLDYFGITDTANLVYRTTQSLKALVEGLGRSLSDFIFGSGGESRDKVEQVGRWMRTLSEDITWPPVGENVTRQDVLAGSGGNTTDLCVLDVPTPVQESMDYNGQCIQLAGETGTDIIDTDGQVIGTRHLMTLEVYSVSASTLPSSDTSYPQGYLADFRPVDMLRDDPDISDLWSRFHDQYYGDGEDRIYDTIRESVKNMTSEMASIVSDFIDRQDLTLSGFGGGAYAVDPGDDTSVMDAVGDIVLDAVSQAVERIRQEPATLSLMLSALSNSQSRLILDLEGFVADNYDVLADRDMQVRAAADSLAAGMLLNSSMTVVANRTESESYAEYNDLGHLRGYEDGDRPAYNCTAPPDQGICADVLADQNREAMRADLWDHANASYSILRAAEAGWDYAGSPDNGLYVMALDQAVREQPGKVTDRFLGMDPGSFISLGTGMVMHVLDGMLDSGEMANLMYTPLMAFSNGSGPVRFDLYEGEQSAALESGSVWYAGFNVTQPDGVICVTPADSGSLADTPQNLLSVRIGGPSGTHYTDIATFSTRPFETTWNIDIRGSVRIRAASEAGTYLDTDNGTHRPAVLEHVMDIDLCIPVTAYSGWDLAGVEYDSTSTLAGDLGKLLDMMGDFLGWVWDTISGPIDWLIDQIMKVVDFFADIIGTLLSYASDIMDMVVDLIDYLVGLVQDFLRDVAGWVFDSIVGWIIDHLPDGLEFTFKAFGFTFAVSFGSKDEIEAADDGDGGTLITVETSGSILGTGFDFGVELCSLPDAAASAVDMDYDLILRSSVRMSGFRMDTTIDPFMALQDHLVECRGTGAGWGLDLVIPEVEAYDSVSYSLHDIPGVGPLLSNIPIPFLGLKASVNAGLDIKYTLRGLEENHVVINEVEMNPRGTDSDQWVELYNPTDTARDLGGWFLVSAGDNRTVSLPPGTLVEAGGYAVLDMADRGIVLPKNGLVLRLEDASGTVVDSTPALSEVSGGIYGGEYVGPLGSQMTWQRTPNGANLSIDGSWEFSPATAGSENPGRNITFKDLVWALLKDAFTVTWDQLKDDLELSLDFIVELVTGFIQHFIDDVLRVVERSVVETSLFLDVMLTDMSGTAGAGITLSFVIEGGNTLVSILRWIIGSVSAFLAKFGKPTQPAQYPKLDAGVPEHLYVRLEFYGLVQLPGMIRDAAGLSGGAEAEPVKLGGRIEANIPALAALVGKDMGRWRINFGVYVDDMPAAIADPLFGTGDGVNPDVWLFKGSVFEI